MTTPRKPRLVWRRLSRERMGGGMGLHYAKVRVAAVYYSSRQEWAWNAYAAGLGIPFAVGRQIETREEAMEQATEYVRGCLARREDSRE